MTPFITAIAVTLILCAVMTGLGLLIVVPALRMMATPADVFDQAQQYLTIYFSGLTGLLIYTSGPASAGGGRYGRSALFFVLFRGGQHRAGPAFCDPVPRGVAGVAYATILAQLLSAALVLIVLSQDSAPYGIRWAICTLTVILRRILKIGMPSAIQQAVPPFSNVFVQGYITRSARPAWPAGPPTASWTR
jgi:Na+-driven multidrug efflux pump